MNPIRALIITLSRIPPRIMLLTVLGFGLLTAWLVTGEMDKSQRSLLSKIDALQKKGAEQPKVVYVEAPAKPAEPATPDFQQVLKPGYRAISIPVDASNGSTRFMKPGSHVDVMAITGSGNETEATPILSDVEVVAVGSSFERGVSRASGEPSNSVTVSVQPRDAAKILKAQVAGKLYLTLRSDLDRAPLVTSDPTRAKPRTLPGIAPPPPVLTNLPSVTPAVKPTSHAPAAGPQVETWEGNRKDVVSFSRAVN